MPIFPKKITNKSDPDVTIVEKMILSDCYNLFYNIKKISNIDNLFLFYEISGRRKTLLPAFMIETDDGIIDYLWIKSSERKSNLATLIVLSLPFGKSVNATISSLNFWKDLQLHINSTTDDIKCKTKSFEIISRYKKVSVDDFSGLILTQVYIEAIYEKELYAVQMNIKIDRVDMKISVKFDGEDKFFLDYIDIAEELLGYKLS